MEWDEKVKLAKALNTGNNKEACQIILNNEMDMQAWDMFLTGMDLRQYEDYRPLLPKIRENEKDICQNLGIREVLRMNTLIVELEAENEKQNIDMAGKNFIDGFLESHIDYTLINNEEDNYEAGRRDALFDFGADIFKAGADWRINSVWHDANEMPKKNDSYIAVYNRYGIKTDFWSHYQGWEKYRRLDKVKKWAYLEDLLSTTED